MEFIDERETMAGKCEFAAVFAAFGVAVTNSGSNR